MFPLVSLAVSPTTALEFLHYIKASDGALDAGAAADEAIRDWLRRRREEAVPGVVEPVRDGYRWKCLYLPEGTLLKLWRYPEHGRAEVVGGQLMFNGAPTSPNRFVLGCTGTIRNAWMEIDVMMPGDKRWICARDRRWRIFSEARPPVKAGKPLPPADEIQPWDWRHLPPGERLYDPGKPPRCR